VAGKAPDSIRSLILETAKTLLRRYGNDKMTVVDIARSLGMSHANIYRFFTNKSAILDAITDEWLSKLEQFVEEIAIRPASAAERIEAVVVELHRKRKEKFKRDSEVFETYRRLVEVRPEVAAQRREKILSVFKRLIEEGLDSNEFADVDIHTAAIALKDGTALFLHPFLIPTTLNEATDARAKAVVRFILSGFTVKHHKSPRPASAKRAHQNV
jgi:AcrR family transcriptional regulator